MIVSQETFPKVFAVKHKNEEVRSNSRSGGVFTAFSDNILKKNGVIYGCVMDADFTVHHYRAETSEERNRMRGSKYVQSDMRDTFRQVKKDLEEGRHVLFSGTSCQVAGLKGYLKKEYSNLLCIDIVCHGVPSPEVFQKYIQWQKSKHGGIRSFDFRNKADFGWKAHVETLKFENGEKIDSTVFKTIFYGHAALRPCCYHCPYKSVLHPADVTIADYWGIDEAAPGFNDNKGVSLVLINNSAGEKAFETIKETLDWRSTRLEDSMQPPLKKPFPAPDFRDDFWKDFHSKDFDVIVKKYGTVSIWKRIKRKIRSFIK